MKRSIVAWILALALVLALPTAALAATPAAPETPAAAEAAAPETEALALRADALATRQAAAREEAREQSSLAEGPETDAPQSGGGTVNLTLRLPAGGSLDGSVRVYLYRAAETDASGLVLRSPQSVQSQRVTASGSGDISLRFADVTPGDYFFAVSTTSALAVGVSSSTLYFHGDGSPAKSSYLARSVQVTAGATLSRTLSLPAPAHSISGVIRFPQPLAQDLSVDVEAWPYGDGSWYSTYVSAPAGATEVPFRLGVDDGTYTLEFYGDSGSWYYYSYVNDLTTEYDERAWFAPTDGDLSGLTVKGDALLPQDTQPEERESCIVTVTVTLPVPLAVAERIYVSAYVGEETSPYVRTSTQAAAGAQEVRVNLPLPRDRAVRLGYSRLSAYNSSSYTASPDERYAAEDGGITGLLRQAKRYTFTGETAEVALTEAACRTIRGKLTRDLDTDDDWRGAYALADFADGEHFAAYAVFAAGAAEADYVIYVPLTEAGQRFTLSAAFTANRGSNRLLPSTRVQGGSYTLDGDTSVSPLALPLAVNRISGTMTFGTSAPTGGMLASLQLENNSVVYYLVPEGAQSLTFSYAEYGFAPGETVDLYANLTGAAGMQRTAYRELVLDDAGNAGNLALNFAATGSIQGTVFLPEGVENLGVNGYVQCSGNGWSSAPFTILEGNSSAAYRLETPLGQLSELSAYVSRDSGDMLRRNRLYIDSSWNCVSDDTEGPELTGDRDGVDFVLQKATRITGRLCLPGGGAIPGVWDTEQASRIGLRLQTEGGSSPTGTDWVPLAEDGSWSLTVPDGLSGDYYLRVTLDYEVNRALVGGDYYYTGGVDRVAEDRGDAALLHLEGAGAEGVRVPVPDGWVLSGELRPAEGGYFHGSDSCFVYAQTGRDSYNGQTWISEGSGPWSYRICVPRTAQTYRVSIDQDFSSMADTNILFRAVREEVQVDGDRSGVDLPLPVARSVVSGQVFRPAGFSNYISGEVTVQMRTDAQADGASYTGSFYLNSSQNSSSYAQSDYRVLIPQEETATQYIVYARSYSNGLARTLYATADGGVSTRIDEAGVFSLGESARHDFPLRVQPPYLSGKIYLPEELTLPFQITVSGNGSQSFYVDPASCQRDAVGRYFPYQLTSSAESFYYRPQYRVSSDENGCLETGVWYTLDAAGGSHRYVYEVDQTWYAGEGAILDFTPLRWTDGSEQNLIQSPHGIQSGSWSFRCTCPGAARIRFHFNERSTNSQLEYVTGEGTSNTVWISSDMELMVYSGSVTLNYSPDFSQPSYGFGIDGITYYDEDGYELSALTPPSVVCAFGGAGEEALAAARSEAPLEAVVAGLTEGQRVLAAVYKVDGQLLGLAWGEAVTSVGLNTRFRFDLAPQPEAAALKLLLLDGSWKPLGPSWETEQVLSR